MKKILKILTFNLKNDTLLTIRGYRFENRYQYIKLILNTLDYDMLGVQELNNRHLEQIQSLLPNYTMVGVSRNPNKTDDELSAIFYVKDRFTCIKENTYWLSSSPATHGSKLKFSIFPRICTLCLLKDQTSNQLFLFINTHLDHLLPYTRNLQIQQLIQIINEFKQGLDPYILISGDFNTTLKSSALNMLLNSQLNLNSIYDQYSTNTLHFFKGKQSFTKEPIDHIFYDKRLKLINYKIINDHFDGHYPSDHFPVVATFEI